MATIVVAVVITAGVFAASVWFPNQPTNPTTPTTPTTPTGGYGPLAVEYLETRRDDVEFYFLYNCSLVNEDLSSFYDQTESGAFVDMVKMISNGSHVNIEVSFSPWSADLVGRGAITDADWALLNGALIDNGLGMMTDATEHPDDFPHTWPVTFLANIYFDDFTFFEMGYTESDGMVFIRNGTWTGEFNEWGQPDVTGHASFGYWLNEGGHLGTPLTDLSTAITENVQYP